jgi:hypothetical protein
MAKIDKLIGQAQQHLEPGERIDAAVQGAYETKRMGQDTVRTGAFLATDRRIVFYAKRLGGHDLESFPYGNISSFASSKKVMGQAFRFAAPGNTVSVKWIKDDSALAQFSAIVRERAGRGVPAAATPVPVQASAADRLRQLTELHAQGLVSDTEFAAKRQELLSQI